MPCIYPVALVDIDACQPERCPSPCDSQRDCVLAAVTTVDAVASSPYLVTNLNGGELDEWAWTELTEWASNASAVECLGKFLVIVSEVETAILYSDDRGVTRVEVDQTQVTDWATHGPRQIDALDQTFIIIIGADGYIWGSWDGARTWETLHEGTASAQDLNRVMIARDNPQVIFVIGAANTVLKSENGGESWYAIQGPGGLYGAQNLTALWVIDEHTVLIGDDAGNIWETVDGGESWTAQVDPPNLPTNATISDIVGCGCGILWMTVKDEHAQLEQYNVIYRNVDGGANGRWYRPDGIVVSGVYHVPFYWPSAIACCGANRAIAVGGDTDEIYPTHGEIVLLA